MYLYIYDSFLSQPKYANTLATIERRVTDLDIKGKIARLTILKNVRELITDAVKNGVTTVVAIGDDQTFAKIINVIATVDVTLGFIPIDSSSKVARVLGIPPKELACDVLAARITKKIDLGKINNQYFINHAVISDGAVTINCDSYSLESVTDHHLIQICNVGGMDDTQRSNPTDGVLEAIITPIERTWMSKRSLSPTVLPFKKISIQSRGEEEVAILADDQIVVKTPAEVAIAPQKLKIIVGTNRMFD